MSNNPRLGDFELLREIGRGGMGIVYQARQVSLDRIVAVKMLHAAAALDSRKVQRFENEALAAGSLQLSGVVPVLAVGEDAELHFLAMPLISGPNLGQVLDHLRWLTHEPHRAESQGDSTSDGSTQMEPTASPSRPWQGPWPPAFKQWFDAHAPGRTLPVEYFRWLASMTAQVARALQHVHDAGIIHRDIKPSNLIIDQSGQVWITDFGLAQLHAGSELTVTGDVIGTVNYMSPEQASGDSSRVQAASDIYSIGATLYELVTLHPPFGKRNAVSLLHQIQSAPPQAAHRLRNETPHDLSWIIQSAMATEPADRYQSADALADDLTRFTNGHPVTTRQASRAYRVLTRMKRDRRTWIAAVTVSLAVVILSVSGSLYHIGRLSKMNRQLQNRDEALQTMANVSDAAVAFQMIEQDRTIEAREIVRQYQRRHPASTRQAEWRLLDYLTHPPPVRRLETGAGASTELAISSDSDDCICVHDDGTISRWRLSDHQKTSDWHSQQTTLRSVAISPDGQLLATGGERVQLWSLKTEQLLADFGPAEAMVESLAFSPDGKLLAIGARYAPVLLVRVPDGQPHLRLDQRSSVFGRHRVLRFADRGRLLIEDGRNANGKELIRIWDLTRRDILHDLDGGSMRNFAISSDGQWIACTGIYDPIIRIYHLPSGRLVRQYAPPGSVAFAMEFSPDGKTLAIGCRDGSVRLIQADPRTAYRVDQPGGGSHRVKMQLRVAAAIAVDVPPFWNDAELREWSFQADDALVEDILFADDGRLFTTCTDGSVRVWRGLRTSQADPALISPQVFVQLATNVRGDRLAAIDGMTFRLWRNAGHANDPWQRIPLPTSARLRQVRFVRNDKQVAVATESGELFFVDDREQTTIVPADPDATAIIADFIVTSDGQSLVTAYANGQVTIRQCDASGNWHVRHRLQVAGRPLAIALNSSGELIAVGGESPTIDIFQIDTGNVVRQLPVSSHVPSLAWHSQKHRLASAHSNGRIYIWNTLNGKQMRRMTGHTLGIRNIAFDRESRILMSCSSETVRLWHFRSGKRIATLLKNSPLDKREFTAARFNPRGDQLFVIAQGDTAGGTLWRFPWATEFAAEP